jgi:two-component system NtrC family sensor kinase
MPELQDLLRSSLRGDIAVQVDVPGDVWPVQADPTEFELAILNIAVNARDAMPNGGRLTLAASNLRLPNDKVPDLAGDFVAVTATDTGQGIAPEVMGHIFEPFFTTKEVGKGTGLGLSQVYGFARQCGGTANVTSQSGYGTTITLYLPRSELPVTAARVEDERATLAHHGRGLRVLLVEDNPEVAEIARTHLQEFGYDVAYAARAEVALEVLDSGSPRFDAVFTDIVMPGEINGLDLARRVRLSHPGLPVVLATGYSSVAQEALDEGFLILRKPYDLRSLGQALTQAAAEAKPSVPA